MLVTSNIKITPDMEALLKKLYDKNMIRKNEYSRYLKECENNEYKLEISAVSVFNTNTFRGYERIIELGKEIGETLPDYTGYRIYDRFMWQYSKLESGDDAGGMGGESVGSLKKPEVWFDDMICPPNRNFKLVKYNEEIEHCIRFGKIFYHIGTQIKGRNPIYLLEDMNDFEKIITIENRKTGTKMFYGVWS